MVPRRRHATAVICACALLAGLGGCAADVDPLPGVDAQLAQWRSDVAERMAQVRISNQSETELVISRLTFEDDWFDGVATRDTTSTIAVGGVTDLRIELPPVVCDGIPSGADRASRVVLQVEGVGEVTLDLVDALGFSERLHARECLHREVDGVARIDVVGFEPSDAPAPGSLELAVRPGGADATVDVVELRTTNLLQFADRGGAHRLGVRISGDDDPFTIGVPLVPSRCDPHAVLEDKRGTIFGLEVRLGERDGVIELVSPGEVREEMLGWVTRWCGYADG